MSVQGVVLLPAWPIYTVCGRGGANECSGCGISAPRTNFHPTFLKNCGIGLEPPHILTVLCVVSTVMLHIRTFAQKILTLWQSNFKDFIVLSQS